MNLTTIQTAMREQRIDAWLIYDFRGSNSILPMLVPSESGKRNTTRRAACLIPSNGDATVIAHGLDAAQFEKLPEGFSRHVYLSWVDLRGTLEALLLGRTRIAMEYSPGCSLPVVSMVDAGTVELVRSMGVEVVSSAELIQACVAVWSEAAVREHAIASQQTGEIVKGAFAFIAERLRSEGGKVSEYEVQQHIMSRFAALGLETPDGPIVAANAHAGDPHFEVSATAPSQIAPGDWVLIDLWARRPGDDNIFSDITWTGYVPKNAGDTPSPRHRKVYDTVNAARDASVKLAQQSWAKGEKVQGWQLDDAARNVLINAGFPEYVRHRTGHSLSPGQKVHGVGMNLDNLETHDTREMTAGIGFTIEPGLYLPDFGVRSEINMYVHPTEGPIITSCVQTDIVMIR
ncbi:MAG: aminopeptidase P family protein [Pyrinomonadaceae bacterium]|nr:aminopeptidase P family protein [Phycisphaerales bacterium]